MEKIIENFFKQVREKRISIYNEFSLQHELGIYLREQLPEYTIEFERNVSHFNFDKSLFIKKEIDIAIYDGDNLHSVIELKYPRNGQVPEQMYSFCKDIVFLEQLKSAGFESGYFVAVADDPLFYSGNAEGIYGMFREGHEITGEVEKPTGAESDSINIKGSYTADWQSVDDPLRYALIKV